MRPRCAARIGISVCLSLLLASAASAQTTWYVDAAAAPDGDGSAGAPFRTIQEGLSVAITAGDTVQVAPGTYTSVGNRNLDFGGRQLTLICPGGPQAAIIDCENMTRAMVFDNGEGSNTIVDGFTIRNGYTDGTNLGGGIYCIDSSPIIRNCIIENCSNTATEWDEGGGGVAAAVGAAPIFIDCTFDANIAGKSGGAILAKQSTITCRGCTFTDNLTGTVADSYGGAAYGIESNMHFRDCVFDGNRSRGMGGGGAVGGYRVWTTFTNCTITHNSGRSGGAYVISQSQGEFWNCLIAHNTASLSGGALSCGWTSDLDMYGCALVGNVSGGSGGGAIYLQHHTHDFINCTFADNQANGGGAGGAIWNWDSATVNVLNCVLWGNTSDNGPQINVWSANGTVNVNHSLVEGGADDVAGPGTLNWGDGNLTDDPQFLDPASDDYRPAAGAPGNDAGNNAMLPSDEQDVDDDGTVGEPLPTDIIGGPRWWDDAAADDVGEPAGLPAIVDMGAYEYYPDCDFNGVPDSEQPDSDDDGTIDACDGCPDDEHKTSPGECGCGVPDTDSDDDGTPDCNDGCPDDPDKIEPGACGCGVADTDGDNDGTPDCNDGCPDDPNKTEPGDCGCGNVDTDSDGDGIADCNDACPDDPDKTAPGDCGCGNADTDTDGDGVADCIDNCVDTPNSDQIDADNNGVGDVCEDDQQGQDQPGLDDDTDGNGDGVPDEQQDHVSSFENDDGVLVTVVAPEGVTVTAAATANPSPADMPSDAEFPLGFLTFQAEGVDIGGAVVMTIMSDDLPADVNSYWKYGPTPDDSTSHWYEFIYDGTTGAEFTADGVLLHFVDGGRGDSDLTANGDVDDPGALAVVTTTDTPDTQLPATCGAGMCGAGSLSAMLVTLMGLGGMKAGRRRTLRRR